MQLLLGIFFIFYLKYIFHFVCFVCVCVLFVVARNGRSVVKAAAPSSRRLMVRLAFQSTFLFFCFLFFVWCGVVWCVFCGPKNDPKTAHDAEHNFDRNMSNLGPIFQFEDAPSRSGRISIRPAHLPIFAGHRCCRTLRREAGQHAAPRLPPAPFDTSIIPAPKTRPSPAFGTRCGLTQKFYAPRSVQTHTALAWRTLLAHFLAIFILAINRPISAFLGAIFGHFLPPLPPSPGHFSPKSRQIAPIRRAGVKSPPPVRTLMIFRTTVFSPYHGGSF